MFREVILADLFLIQTSYNVMCKCQSEINMSIIVRPHRWYCRHTPMCHLLRSPCHSLCDVTPAQINIQKGKTWCHHDQYFFFTDWFSWPMIQGTQCLNLKTAIHYHTQFIWQIPVLLMWLFQSFYWNPVVTLSYWNINTMCPLLPFWIIQHT